MKNKYYIIKQLVELLESFEEEDIQQKDLLGFAEWIITRIREEPSLNTGSAPRRSFTDYSQHFAYLKNFDERARFLEYISRISRFHEFYIRKYLNGFPLNSRLEYIFLYTVGMMDRAKKTDLINMHLIEYSTGMDTIRRLINNELMEEKPDESDKRVRLLELTVKGKKVLEDCNVRLKEERSMFLACISPNKWKKTLTVLEEINEFHNSIYMNHSNKPPAELSNLIDSLKHLHK
jgi:DNA-binding MarR family transcriptional regulator